MVLCVFDDLGYRPVMGCRSFKILTMNSLEIIRTLGLGTLFFSPGGRRRLLVQGRHDIPNAKQYGTKLIVHQVTNYQVIK